MNNKYYKVDLHVHTPSSQCYKGDKTENGYWQVLRCAVENEVRVIAITDHNSIEGYEKLIELKEKTLMEYDIVKKYDISEDQKKDLYEKVRLFESVTILLGVEITLNPGIHIIVLSDDKFKDDINLLLDEMGYTSDNRGSDTDIVPEKDIKEFLSNPKLSGKIVLAPHVDSDKGIWKVLDGNYRATIFKSNIISAITCNNSKQLESIKDLTRNDPKYKRVKPFVCINASDAHIPEDIGNKCSYFKLSSFSFEEFRKAFDYPEEYISDTETQDFIDYVKKCAEYKPTINLYNINELEKSCYAIMNNGYGCILLGITPNFQQVGITSTCENIENNVKEIIQKIKAINNTNFTSYKCNTERLGNGKCVGVIIIESEFNRLWINGDDELYIFDSKKGSKLAKIKDVEEIVRAKILDELQDFEKRSNDTICDAITKMQHVLNPISKYIIYDKLKAISVPITYYFDIDPVTTIISNAQKIYDNGEAEGNVFYTTPAFPRLDDAYLRFSCPVYQIPEDADISNLLEINQPLIVITLCGGCHIINSRKKCYFECRTPSILLKPNQNFYDDNISLYHIIAWLKSNYFIWTCIQKNSDVDILRPNVLFNSFVPNIKEFYCCTQIEEIVKEILSLEQKYLKQTSTLISETNDEDYELAIKTCNEHNKLVNQKASEIENIISLFLHLEDNEEKMIVEDLINEDIFVHYEESECDELVIEELDTICQ